MPRSPTSGFTPVATTVARHRNPEYDGQVISQRPKAGTRVRPGTAVTIVVERYVAPQPTGPSGLLDQRHLDQRDLTRVGRHSEWPTACLVGLETP